jgi:hypothetical protein
MVLPLLLLLLQEGGGGGAVLAQELKCEPIKVKKFKKFKLVHAYY